MTPMTLDEFKEKVLKLKKPENISPNPENINNKEVEPFIELPSKPVAEEVKSEPQNMISESRTNSGPMTLDEFKEKVLKLKKPENITPHPENINNKEVEPFIELLSKPIIERENREQQNISKNIELFNDKFQDNERSNNPDIQNNTLNSELKINWEDFFNSMNNQSSEKKSEELIKVGERKSEEFKNITKDKATENEKLKIFMNKDIPAITNNTINHDSQVFSAISERFRVKDGVIILSSVETRNILSKQIFEVLLNNPTISLEVIINSLIDDIKSNKSWTNEISSDIIEEFKKKLDVEEYQTPLFIYISDLIKIVKSLKDLNDNYEKTKDPLNILALSRDLLEDGVVLGRNKTDKGFYTILVQLFDYLKNNIEDFNLERYSSFSKISKSDIINFCRLYIDFIKKEINVSHNNFDRYIEHAKINNIDTNKIIEHLLSKNSFDYFLQKANLKEYDPNFLRAINRCVQVLILALLKCINYECLRDSLLLITGLKRAQLFLIIKTYIPILIEFNSSLNIKRWLPEERNPPITYDDCIKVAEDKGIIFNMTREEFDEKMKNRGNIRPTQIDLSWKCELKGHEWDANYSNVKKGTACPYCYGKVAITYEDCIKVAEKSEKGIIFNMTREEFDEKVKNRGNTIPSQVDLSWKCGLKGHDWDANYNNVHQGSGCPYCMERRITIGKCAHPILEYLSTIYFKFKNCLVRHEDYINSNSYEFIDLILERDFNFKSNIEKFQKIIKIPLKITQILIDFTLTIDPEFIKEKYYRGYQSETRFLIIVLYLKVSNDSAKEIQNLIQNLNDIEFREHIRVINFDQYFEFLNLQLGIFNWRELNETERKLLQEFNKVISLVADSIESDRKLDEFINLSTYYKNILNK